MILPTFSLVRKSVGALCLASLVHGQSTNTHLRSRSNNANDHHHQQQQQHRNLQDVCAKLPTNFYFHLINHEAHLALHVEDGSLAEGANVVYEYLDDGVHDTFRLVSSGFGNYYHIMAQHSNMAIAVTGGPWDTGANIVQETLADLERQDWCFIPTEGDYYRIENRQAPAPGGGQVIMADWEPNEPDAGKNVYQWWYWGGKQQAWRLEFGNPAPKVDARPAECVGFPPNTFYHITARHSGLTLRQDSATNSNVVQSNMGILDDELNNWRLAAVGNGHYLILNHSSGQAISVDDDGMNLKTSAPNEFSEWCFSGADEGYFNVRNRKTGYSIDIQNWSYDHLGNAASWPYYGGLNQQFKVELAIDSDLVGDEEIGSPTNPPTPPPNTDHITAWKGPFGTPVVGVGLSNLPNGKILVWSAYMREDFGYDTGATWTALYDPTTEDLSEKLVSNTNHDMFCPGTATLPNGDMMVTGGADADTTSIYHYKTNTFTTGAKMVIPRGYHAMAVLGDGSIFTAGGSWHGGIGAKHGEIWNPSTDAWSLLPGVQVDPLLSQDAGGVYRSDNHFWLFQSPVDNMLFHAGPSKQMSFIDTSGEGSIIPSVVRESEDRMSGNAMMIDIGVVFIVGGSPNYDSGAGTKKAFLVDINDPTNVQSKQVGSMEFARTLGSSVLLPGGKVVVTGGQTEVLLFSDEFAVMKTEIFDPATESFTTLPDQMKIPRTYHSAAILLIDGRVMVAGGGLCGGCTATHNDFEILSPPYLFQADGSLASRPIISGAPTLTSPGETIQIAMADSNAYSFELIRTSAATHSVNNDQRRIPLVRTGKSGRTSTVKIPDNRNVALVGSYYLFAIDANGVPSIATSISIELPAVQVTQIPTLSPLSTATVAPTAAFAQPTSVPTLSPSTSATTSVPTAATRVATVAPSVSTEQPTSVPTLSPSTSSPTAATAVPTPLVTATPTDSTVQPTLSPTFSPTTIAPTISPTVSTSLPTLTPTTLSPTISPTLSPSIAPTTASNPVNLLANGSFEDFLPKVAPNKWGPRDPVGWQSLNGNKIEVHGTGMLGVSAVTGTNFIEMDYHGSGAPDGIFQDIPTEVGRSYELIFYMRTRSNARNSDSEKIVVEWAGSIVGTYAAPIAKTWSIVTATVTGTANGISDRLVLREIGTGTGIGPYLDEVSLVAM